MIGTDKKRHRTFEVADPDFGCAGVEIESTFRIDLRGRVRWGTDLNTNRRGGGKRTGWISDQPAFLGGRKQDDIGDPNLAVASKDCLLDCSQFARVQLIEEIGNSASSLAMIEARWGGHDELADAVDLEAFGTIGECGIAADLEPASDGRIVCKSGHGIARGNIR